MTNIDIDNKSKNYKIIKINVIELSNYSSMDNIKTHLKDFKVFTNINNNKLGEDLVRKILKSKYMIDSRKKDGLNFFDNLNRDLI